jgi:predicted amidohydrolase
VTSIYAGTPYDTIAGRIAVGMDNDLFTPEAAQAAAAAGAQYFVVWPTWNLSTNGRMVRDAVIDRARETGMILAAVFPSTSGPAGIAGASSVVATPEGLVLELPGATECAASVTVAVPIVTAVHPGLAAVC